MDESSKGLSEVRDALADFVVDVAKNWRDADDAALGAMVEVAKSLGTGDAMGAFMDKLKEFDI